MVNQFAIALAEGRQVFQPGETISGVLLLNIDEEIKLRGIHVALHGHGNVRIQSGKVKYVRNESYLNYHSTLLGRVPQQQGQDVQLQRGSYSFPFQFGLPSHSLPTSFEGDYGSVRYWLNAVVDRPWRSNFTTHMPLFMVERVQVSDPKYLEPCQLRDDRTLGWPCCPAGQLFASARIDRTAYCPGEEVKISACINNQSSKQVTATEVQLVQKSVFKAPRDTTRTTSQKVYVMESDQGVPPGEEASAQFDHFIVPSVQPTTTGFGCIDISYFIKVKVRVARALNSEITFPVVITTVPPTSTADVDPAISQQIYRALASFLSSRIAAELDSNEPAMEETETRGTVVNDGAPPQGNGPTLHGQDSEGTDSRDAKPYHYSRMA